MFAVVAGYGSMRCIDSNKWPEHREASKQMDTAHDLVRRGLEGDPTSCECWFQLLPGYVVGGECRAPRQWAGRSKYGLQRLSTSFSRAVKDEYEQELRVLQSRYLQVPIEPSLSLVQKRARLHVTALKRRCARYGPRWPWLLHRRSIDVPLRR